ncbi:aryl-sulfate sulfotransferase [Candidatus Daviesbacteria bacterium]|nr:aryl-sulfate sulfotransferase [Candidatus Daviesbacteria bacterium]
MFILKEKTLFKLSLAISAVSLIIFSSFLFIKESFCKGANPARSTLGQSPVKDLSKTSPGYTLISPFEFNNRWELKGRVYLVDIYGNVVHQWKTDNQPFHALLKPNGNLVTAQLVVDPGTTAGQIPTGLIQELDWQGKVVWEYKNGMLHHDFNFLPNGNIAVIVREKTPPEIATRIQGGVSNTEFKGDIYSDAILELNRQNQVVWEWHADEYLDPDLDKLGPLDTRDQWTHANSVEYLEKDPISGQQAYLISLREIDTVMIIGKKDKQIIWRSPKGMFSHQHDPSLLKNGNILVFDNGLYSEPNPKPRLFSRVVEVDPKTNQIVWQFDGGTGNQKVLFFSAVAGGAQKLPSGNILITESTKGRLLEITPDKKLVWDFINPYTAISYGSVENNLLFKARRYSVDEINWPEKLSPPISTKAKFCESIR